MPSGFTTDGFTALAQRFQALQAGIVPALAAELHERAQLVLVASQPLVPVVTGALQESGQVLPPEIAGALITVDITYGGAEVPYAASVHANPRSGHTGGVSPSGQRYPEGSYSTVGGPHFLSEPVADVAATLPQEVAQWVGTLTRRLMGQGG